jgi:dienelactone hydrolase
LECRCAGGSSGAATCCSSTAGTAGTEEVARLDSIPTFRGFLDEPEAWVSATLALPSALLIVCAFVSAAAHGALSIEKIEFEVTSPFERRAAVVGELRIPESARERLPAVVIVNSSPGFDGRGAFYAEALNRAGIATLEVDMCQGRGLPASPVHHLPHVFQSLDYLAHHARIDPTRVGVMGLSWGAQVALIASSAELPRRYASGNLRFRAHLPVYPQCWRIATARHGQDTWLKGAPFKAVTGAPVHILTGEKDDYDGPDGCSMLVASMPAAVRSHYSVTVYEGATFGWDHRFGGASYEAGAK